MALPDCNSTLSSVPRGAMRTVVRHWPRVKTNHGLKTIAISPSSHGRFSLRCLRADEKRGRALSLTIDRPWSLDTGWKSQPLAACVEKKRAWIEVAIGRTSRDVLELIRPLKGHDLPVLLPS
jgi:hypothetical protein